MAKSKYWIAFSSIEEIDSSFIQRLYNYFGDIETAFNTNDLSSIDGLSVKKAENFLRLRDKVDIEKLLIKLKTAISNILHLTMKNILRC